jgi:hypothetical protein
MADVKVTLKRVADAQGNTDTIKPTTDWDQVENKPSTFTPTAHEHSGSDITSGTIATARLGSGTADNTTFLRGDNTWATVEAGSSNPTFEILDSAATGNLWYRVARVNLGSGGVTLRGVLNNHVESFGTQKLNISIFGREGDNATLISVDGTFEVAHPGVGVRVLRTTLGSPYAEYDVYIKTVSYTQAKIEVIPYGSTIITLSDSPLTSEPSGNYGVEFDNTSVGEGAYYVGASIIRNLWHQGNFTPSSYVAKSGDTMSGALVAERYRGNNSLVLNNYTTVNPASNVFLYSQPNDRDSWLYLDSADTSSNWGIYHRQIDSAVGGLPGNSFGFIGGGNNSLQAYINVANGDGYFKGSVYIGGSTNNGRIYADDWGIKVGTDSGHIQFGPANSGTAHIYTNMPSFYFNKNILVNGTTLTGNTGTVTSVATGSGLTGGTITTSGTISVDGTVLRTSGSQQITKNAHTSGVNDYHLELYSNNVNAGGEVSLRMHQGGHWWGQIRLRSDGFHFTEGSDNSYRNIYFGTGYGSITGNANTVDGYHIVYGSTGSDTSTLYFVP